MSIQQLQQQAQERVQSSDALRPFAFLLLRDWEKEVGFENYDPEAFLNWVVTASEQEIVTACEAFARPKVQISCSWCHTLNLAEEHFCIECGHEANAARMQCRCPECALAYGAQEMTTPTVRAYSQEDLII